MTPARHRAWIGLGANLGDPVATLNEALAALQADPRVDLVKRSSFYRSAPVDATGPDFVNACAELHTGLAPEALLALLQALESAHGRARPYRNAPRTLDLDLLLFDDVVIDTPVLTLPHPRLHRRAFVLRPLAQIAPDLQLPGLGRLEPWLEATASQAVEPMEAARP